MTHFYEANKDRFIDRNSNLTYEQAQEIKDFFNAHTDAENIIDWNTSDRLTYDDFKNAIDAYNRRNTNSNADRIANKVGLAGIELGKDYLDLGEYTTKSFGTFHAYSPLTHLGAKTLAGPQVPPVQKDKNSAAWCIGYSGNDYYWNKHCKDEDCFIILCGEKIPTLKVCLEIPYYHSDIKNILVWDYYDKYTELNFFFEDCKCSRGDTHTILGLIEDAFDEGAYDDRIFFKNKVDIKTFLAIYKDELIDYYYYYQDLFTEKYGKENFDKVIVNYFNHNSPCDWIISCAKWVNKEYDYDDFRDFCLEIRYCMEVEFDLVETDLIKLQKEK